MLSFAHVFLKCACILDAFWDRFVKHSHTWPCPVQESTLVNVALDFLWSWLFDRPWCFYVLSTYVLTFNNYFLVHRRCLCVVCWRLLHGWPGVSHMQPGGWRETCFDHHIGHGDHLRYDYWIFCGHSWWRKAWWVRSVLLMTRLYTDDHGWFYAFSILVLRIGTYTSILVIARNCLDTYSMCGCVWHLRVLFDLKEAFELFWFHVRPRWFLKNRKNGILRSHQAAHTCEF